MSEAREAAPPAAGMAEAATPGPAALGVGRARMVAASLAMLVLVGVAAGYTLYAVRRSDALRHGPTAGVVAGRPDLGAGGPPRLVFENTRPGQAYGQLAGATLAGGAAGLAADGGRQVAGHACVRVYAAGGTVLCLAARGGAIASYLAEVLGPDLRERAHVPLEGAPSRARLSPDGRLAAWTVFVSGDSYAGSAFSTRTSLYDTRTGGYVDSLESFTAYLNGAVYRRADMNYWGVTFAADDDTFYATMASAGRTYLMRGSIRARSLRALASDVECPSLSPDGRRIAYKRKVSADVRAPWRLYVLSLPPPGADLSGRHLMDGQLGEHPVAETRSVDDQAAWLDQDTVMYGVPAADGAGSNVWAAPADGGGRPRLLAADAASPARLGGR